MIKADLPYTLDSKGRLWNVISVNFDSPVSKTVDVTATCPGY